MDFTGEYSAANPHYGLTSTSLVGKRPFCLRAKIVSDVATAEALAMIVCTFVEQMAMKPDDGTGLNFHRYIIFAANSSCQLELVLLWVFEVIVFEDIAFVATGDDMETAVFLIGSVYDSPGADCCPCSEPTAEVVLVLMPRKTQSDPRCFPDE